MKRPQDLSCGYPGKMNCLLNVVRPRGGRKAESRAKLAWKERLDPGTVVDVASGIISF
jgi:hypothetical protein